MKTSYKLFLLGSRDVKKGKPVQWMTIFFGEFLKAFSTLKESYEI